MNVPSAGINGKMVKYNEEIVKEICGHLEEGMPQKDAAILSGVSEATFYRWISEKKSFESLVEASLSRYKAKLIKIVNVNSIKDGKLALEVLARRWPGEFSSKHIVEVVNPQLELDKIKELIDEKHNKDDKDTKRLVSGHSSEPLQE